MFSVPGTVRATERHEAEHCRGGKWHHVDRLQKVIPVFMFPRMIRWTWHMPLFGQNSQKRRACQHHIIHDLQHRGENRIQLLRECSSVQEPIKYVQYEPNEISDAMTGTQARLPQVATNCLCGDSPVVQKPRTSSAGTTSCSLTVVQMQRG